MTLLLVLMLFALTSGFVLEQSRFEAVEGANITLRWSSPDKADLSLLHMNCHLTTSSEKVVFEIFRGVEEYLDVEFLGRIEFNKEALKQGHVVLHVTGLRALDSGLYQCEMAATDQDRREWVFTSTEYFTLEVTPTGTVTMTTSAHREEERETPIWVVLSIVVSVFVWSSV